MASIKELYDASMKHGLLNSKVDEQAFVDMLGNNRLRQQYYRYVNEKIPGAFSTNYDEFSKNIDNGLADYASAPKGVNPPVIGDENQKEQALQEIAPGVPMQQTPAQPQAPQQSMAGKIAGKAMSAVGNAAQFISSPQAYIAKQFVKNDYKMGKALYDEMQYEATDAERQQWDEQEKPVADLINTAAEDVNRHFKQMADERAQRYNASANAFIPQAAQGAMGMDSTQSQENKNYTAANELLQQAAVRLQGTHKGDANFLTMGKEFLKQGATKMTNLFSNGITDVMVEKTAADLINKADDLGVFDGEVAAEDVLSQDEITLLNAVVAKAGAEFARKDNTSMLTAAGTQTADMLPFMRDIALGKGIFGGLTESAQKGIFRLILSNVGNGNGARFAANASKMALGLAESGVIASALPTTYANAFKGTGNLDGRVSVQDGEIFIDGANTEGIGKAVADAWADQTQELFTETGGNFKLMGRAFADTGIGRALGSTKLKNLQNKFAKTAFGKFAKGVAFDGVAGEWLEEVEGNFYDVMGALIHPQQEGHGVEEAGQAWDAFWNMETQVPMLLSFSVPALGGHAINGAQYAYHATQVNSAKKSLGELLRGYGYDRADIEESIRNIRMVTAASTPNDLAKNISELATTFVDQSQIREYNKANRQLQQLESKETLNAEQQKRVDQLKNDLANNQVTKFISAATQYAVADANMGAIYAGHQEEIRDLRDEYKITQDVQSHTNSTDNNVYHLADNDGNEVGYVTNGKISVDNEGNISLGQSDSRVLVTNPMTGVSSYMPLVGLRVDAPVMSADEEISARVAQEKARKQGMATFRPGQRVNVKTPDGQVVPDANPSEVVGVTDNGVQVTTENPDGTIGVAEVPHEQAVEGLEPVEEGGMNITLDLEEGQGNSAETLDVIDNATNKPISLVKLENEGGYIDPVAATLYSEEDVKARIADGTWKEAAQGENGNASAQVPTQQKKTAPAQENAPSALQNQNNLVSLQRAGGERVWAAQLQEALDKECPLPCEVATKEDIISGAVQFPQSMVDAVSNDSLVLAYITGGRVYVVSDHITDGAMADAVILQHECLHDYIKNNANAHYGMQAFARNHSREELLGMLSLVNADVEFYSNRYKADTQKNREALADEVIANASQFSAENGMEPETKLKAIGLNPLEVSLINTIINGNKQQIAEYGSASRRGQNDNSPVEGEGLASVRSVLPEAGSRAGGMGRQGDRPVELMQPAAQGAEQVTEEQVEEPRGSLKGDADVANAVAYKSGAEIETEDGSEGGRFSTAANFEGAGFVCRDADDNPLVDAEGNVYVTMGGRRFDANHPITADDIAANDRSPLNLMLADAKAIANVDIAEDIHHKYADLLNMYLEKGSKEKGGWDNINGENAKWRWLGDTVYKTVAKNGDAQYSYSIDITRVCKKNEAVINTISEVQRRYGYGITPSQIMDIYLKTDQNGYQVPCPVCYVFSRYIRNGKYATAAINGMLKYGKHLPGGKKKDVWTAQQWYEELQRVQEMQNNPIVKKALEGANEDVVKIEGMIDAIGEEILRGRQNKTLTQEREAELMKQIQQLDARYRAALQVISQQSLSNWIKMFAIKTNPKAKANYYEVVTVIDTDNDGNEIPEEKRVEKKVKYVLRDDAKMPTDIEDFKNNALDFGLTANVIQNYPGIMRLRKSGGSAAGKTITFVSNNDLGDIIQGVATGNPESIKKAEEFYTKAVNAKTDEERAEMLKRAAYERKNNYQKAAEAKTEKEFKKYKDAATANFRKAYLYAQRQSLRGGQRMWSWSDNIESLSPDVVVNLMQMSMLGGALQSYSKQLEGINLVASMDGYVNGSLMGYGLGYQELNENEVGKDENGNLIYTGEDIVVKDRKGTHIRTQKGAPAYQTADGKYITLVFDDVVGVQAFGQDGKEGLFDLNKRLDKAGNILVGMDDNHVLAAMADNRVFFIIPWHASGQSNHILAQMYDYLGVQLVQNGHGATDFTKVQEEKSMSKVTGKAHKNLMAFYDAHNFESVYPCAFHIDHNGESGKISEDQRRYKELRDAIFDGISNLTPEQLDLIEKDEFLSQVVRKMDQRGLDSMTDGDKNYIYPYEYWDEESTEEDADVNGARYVEYCRRLGKKPKFCGMLGEGKAGAKDFGNFVGGMLPDGTMFGHKGYWKLLIDRRMYDVDGDFQDLGQTDASGFYPEMVDPEWTEKHFKVTQVADAEGVQKIADDVTNLEKTRHMGKAPMVDYGLDILGAAQEYLRITGEDFDPNDGGGNGGGIKPKKNETAYTYAKRLAAARSKSAAVSDSFDAEAVGNDGNFSVVTDKALLDKLNAEFNGEFVDIKEVLRRLENGEELPVGYTKMYRAVRVINGKVYSPKMSKLGGVGNEILMGQVEQSDERPDLAYPVTLKSGKVVWKVDLDGSDPTGGKLKKRSTNEVDYNPYIHLSSSPMNDQFVAAYAMPEMSVIEVAVPLSEFVSGYRADKAAAAVGVLPWHKGVVQTKLKPEDQRVVMLSRYDMPLGEVSVDKVADMIADQLKNADVAMPYNLVTPKLAEALLVRGVKVDDNPSGNTSKEQDAEWKARRAEIESGLFSVKRNPNATEQVDKMLAVKDTSRQKFTEEIFEENPDKRKTIETRDSVYMFKRSLGDTKRIGIIRTTGNIEDQLVEGYVTVDKIVEWHNKKDFDAAYSQHHIPESGSPYSWKPDTKIKYGIVFSNPVKEQNPYRPEGTIARLLSNVEPLEEGRFATATSEAQAVEYYDQVEQPTDETFDMSDPAAYEGMSEEEKAINEKAAELAAKYAEYTELINTDFNALGSYEDKNRLMSRISRIANELEREGIDVPRVRPVGRTAVTITTFSGGGLVEQALRKYIDDVVAVEYDKKIVPTHKANNPGEVIDITKEDGSAPVYFLPNGGKAIILGGIQDVDLDKLEKALDGMSIEYLHGSPVCKNYSTANSKKKEARNFELDKVTAEAYANFIRRFEPEVVSVENVMHYKKSEAFQFIKDALNEIGYNWDVANYTASNYGGATKRRRMIVRAVRDGYLPPKPAFKKPTPWNVRTKDLLEGLPKADIAPSIIRMLDNQGIDYKTNTEPILIGDNGHGKARISKAGTPAFTILAGGDEWVVLPGGDVRKPTPRFLARIMGLDDKYVLPESVTLAHTIIGNGVPTELTEAVIAPVLIKHIIEKQVRKRITKDIADQYMSAAESGDMETATRLFDKYVFGQADDNIVPFRAATDDYKSARETAHAMKGETVDGKPISNAKKMEAIRKAAQEMAPLVPTNAVLIPIPSRKGYATDTLLLAKEIAKIIGAPVEERIEGFERESVHDLKKKRRNVTPEKLGFHRVETSTKTRNAGKVKVYIDNVIDKGSTAAAAVRAGFTPQSGVGMVLAYVYSGRKTNKNIRLKEAEVIQRDDEGNIIPLDQRFSNDSSDVRFAVYGKKGAAELDFANEQTYRMDNLDIAREMEKAGDKDARTIKAATGWERGVDGLWRYEMPDGKLKESESKIFGKNIGDIWKDDAIFKAYPLLKRIVILPLNKKDVDNGVEGWYDGMSIQVNPKAQQEDVRRIIAHEIQHAIQHYEGFASGTTPEAEESFVKKYYDIDSRFEPVINAIAAFGEKMSRRELIDEFYDDEELADKLGGFEKMIGILEGMTDEEYSSIASKLKNNGPYHRYKQSAGEVESRNVEKRLNMSPAERRESLLSETEDVKREDQILLNADQSDFARFSVASKDKWGDIRDMYAAYQSGGVKWPELIDGIEDYNKKSDEPNQAIQESIDAFRGWNNNADMGASFDDLEYAMDNLMENIFYALYPNGDYEKSYADEHRLQTEPIQPGENLGMFATRLTRDEAIRSYMDVMTDAQSEMTKRARQLYQMVADNAAPIERFQEWVFKNGEIGKDSRYDAYSDVFLASGRVTRATELFHRDIVNPLAEYMKGIINDGTLDNIGIDTPDGGKADIVWHDVKNERNGEKLTARELIGVYAQAKDIVEAQQLVLPNRGYEGFVETIGFEPKQVIKAVEDALGEERTNELWNRIRKTTKFALDYERRGGYIDQETYDTYQDRMFYVPQRGWRKRDMGDDADSYISGGGSLYNHPYNAVLIKAKGRESLAGDPFAYIISIGESAIISTENNKIKQKFLALCRANEDLGMKSGAFTVEQKWVANVIGADGKVLKQDGSPVVRLMDGRPDKDTIEHDNEIKAKIKTLQKALNMSTKAGTRAVLQTAIDNLRDELIIAPNKSVDFLVERTDAEKQQHSVIVLVDGQKVVIHLQDAELANAINNNFEKNQQGLLDIAFLDKPRRATRALSAALTQYNPEFAARNFWRDSQVALMTILAENKELAPDAIKNLVLAQRAIGSFVADEKFRDRESEDRSMKSGVFKTITKKDDEGNDIEVKEEMTYKELLNEYFDSGAATGYSFLKELNQQQQDFDKLLKDHKFEKAGKCIFGALSFLTEMSETSVRFAAYAAARQHGWDIDRAAIMSKELTTNFDRAGSSTNSPLFSWFSFTKATINGNLKFFKAFKKAPWAYASIAAAYMMIGFLQAMLEPDDPEKERNISSFTRGSNLIIGKWKIPCAHFLRIFHSWGVETALAIRGDKRYTSALADAVNTTTGEIIPSQFNLLNHWGEGDDWYKDYLQGAAPTAVSPFVDIWLNRDFKGAPVNREYYSIKEEDKKDIFFSRKSTPEAWNKIAEGVYKYIGGGNMKSKYKGDDNAWAARFDFSGSTLEHIVMGYSPAIAETLFNTATMVMKACDPNEELKATDVTFLRDVRRTYDAEKDYKGEYYDLKNRYDEYKDLLADYKKNDRDSYRKERNSDKYKLYKEIERSRAIKKKPEDGATYTPEQINKLREFNKKWNRI